MAGTVQLICSGHTTGVTTVAFSPDGRMVGSATGTALFGGATAELKLWDSASGKEILALRGHTGGINALAFSPDGRGLASGGDDKTARVWSTTRNQEVQSLGKSASEVFDMGLSFDGRRVAIGSLGTELLQRGVVSSSGLRVWDARTGNEVGPLIGVKGQVIALSFSPTGDCIATESMVGFASKLQLWDRVSGRRLQTFPDCGGSTPPLFSPDGKRVAVWNLKYKNTTVWDVQTGQEITHLAGGPPKAFSHDDQRLAIASFPALNVWGIATGKIAFACADGDFIFFSPDSRYFAVGQAANTIQLLETATGKRLADLNGRLLGFTPDSRSVAYADKDQRIKFRQVVTGKEVVSLSGHTGFVTALAISRDGKYAASASTDKSVRVWDTATGATVRVHTLENAHDQVDFSADFRHFMVSPFDLQERERATVRLYSLPDCKEVLAFPIAGDPNSQHSVIVAGADGRSIAAISISKPVDSANQGSISVWDAQAKTELGPFPSLSFSPSFALSPDGQRLAVAVAQRTKDLKPGFSVQVWEVSPQKKLHRLPGQTAEIRALAYSPDGRLLASSDREGIVEIWAANTGEEFRRFQAGKVIRLKFSPNGKRLACLAEDASLQIWEVASPTRVCSLPQATGDVAFSKDGQRVAAGSGENHARVWDANTGTLLLSLVGHGATVQGIDFSPDCKRIATANADRTVRIWDAASGRELFVLRGSNEALVSLAFEGDGRHLVAADAKGTVQIWDASPPHGQ